jgi:hypothetical protein
MAGRKGLGLVSMSLPSTLSVGGKLVEREGIPWSS